MRMIALTLAAAALAGCQITARSGPAAGDGGSTLTPGGGSVAVSGDAALGVTVSSR